MTTVLLNSSLPYSISSKEILAIVAAEHEYSLRPEVLANIVRYAETRLAAEYKLIQSVGTCGLPKITALSDRLGGLDSTKLAQVLQKQIQNPNALHAIMCVTDAILYVSPYDMGSTLLNDRIRSYFSQLHTLGPPSTEGITMTGKFDNVGDFMVLKSARDQSRDALLHEGVVGMYGTNQLREIIPNFAYIFGGFKCSPPLIDPSSKEVITWCLNSENAVNYVLYENITPSIPLSQYVKTCSIQEFLQVYMQVLYALRTAFNKIDFTHYDLHDDNILIRDVVGAPPNEEKIITLSGFQIPYITGNGTEYLKTSKVACIIDYSRAHFKVPPLYRPSDGTMDPGEDIGVSGLTEYSVYPQRSWIMHDLYKLLMFCGRSALQANNVPVAHEISKMFRYFNQSESLQQAVDAQWPVRYSLPLTEMTVHNFTIGNFASHIRNVCDCSFISKYQEGTSLTCTPNICLSEDQTYALLGMSLSDAIPTPTDIINFYELCLRLYNSGREDEMNAMAVKFDYKTAMSRLLAQMKSLIDEMNMYVSRFRSVDLSRMPLEQLLSPGTLDQVRAAYINGGQIADRIATLKYDYVVGIEVAKRYNDAETMAILKQILDEYVQYIKPGLVLAQNVINVNDKYLNSIAENPKVKLELGSGGIYSWYWTGRREYDQVFGSNLAQDLATPTVR